MVVIDYKKEVGEVRRVLSSLALVAPFTYPFIGWPIIFWNKHYVAGTNGVTLFINLERWKKLTFKKQIY